MRKLLKKKAPDSPQKQTAKVSAIGANSTPLYARFASSTQTAPSGIPVISGPAPLSSRPDRTVHQRNEISSPRQSYSHQPPTFASRARNVDKPLPPPTPEDPPEPTPVSPDQTPIQRDDTPLMNEFEYFTPDDFIMGGIRSSRENGREARHPAAQIRTSDSFSRHENRSFPDPSMLPAESLPRLNPSVLQNVHSQEMTPSVATGPGQDIQTDPDLPSRAASRKKFSPMAAFGLSPSPSSQPSSISMERSTSSLGSTITANSSQVDPERYSIPSGPQQLLQQMDPFQRVSPPPQSMQSPQSAGPLEAPDDQRSLTNGSTIPDSDSAKNRRGSLPVPLNPQPDPRVRRDSSGRARVPAPFGPRASLNTGPSNLVQGQPRIFAPMASPEPQEVPLKPGQPRIFAVTNSDNSYLLSPPRQAEYSRYPSPPAASYSSSRSTPDSGSVPEKSHVSAVLETNSSAANTSYRRGTSSRYNNSRSPPPTLAQEERGPRNHYHRQRSAEPPAVPDNTPPRDTALDTLRSQYNDESSSSTSDYATPHKTVSDLGNGHQDPRNSPSPSFEDGSTAHRDVKEKGPEVPRRGFTPLLSQETEQTDFLPGGSGPSTNFDTGDRQAGSSPPKGYSEVSRQLSHRIQLSFNDPQKPINANLKNGYSHIQQDLDFPNRVYDERPNVKEIGSRLREQPDRLEKELPEEFGVPRYPLELHLSDPRLLGSLIQYLTFYEWTVLYALNKKLRTRLAHTPELKEEVLESYLKTIGYVRWILDEAEPLTLSLRDLSEYMRGVSIPFHEYSRISEAYLEARSNKKEDRVVLTEQARNMSFAARAYSRVIIRLRLQAEAIARHPEIGSTIKQPTIPQPRSQHRVTHSRNSSRAPSPNSTYSQAQGRTSRPPSAGGPVNTRVVFTSPIYRPRRAPLLHVFVPSPDEWLSDASVVECESELKRAGIAHLLRPGDTVWDVAVGDEGNAGRMIWDGSYLLDLDYTYSRTGDLPRYLPSLAFSPSYFHRVIRIVGNPIVYIDLAPWAEEIAMNLKLLQDKVKTETPQGNHHNVVRWVHRSSFEIHPPHNGKKIPIPFGNGNWTVDRGWMGKVVVEAEGTNEGLADLQDRCKGAFHSRVSTRGQSSRSEERRRVFRILRERSKPGEIWIRTVGDKERLIP